MSSSTTPHSTSTPVAPEFLEQARHLVCGGELLPGGPEALAKRLQHAVDTQTPLRIKLGLDPTRPDLHLGHAVVLRKLRAFQDLGHQAVLIIGDATALVGDPSGRNNTRPPLSEAQVLENAETYLKQAGKVIAVEKTEIVRNSAFFKDLGLTGTLQLMAQVTVAQILARDDFNKRHKEQVPIALHEFFYPLMQAYDSVMVKADVELGGSDQRFNNLLGRDLQLAYAALAGEPAPNPQLVLLLPLLEGTDGKVKMSKSYPLHCINFEDTPDDMLGKVMSIPDTLIVRYQELLSTLSPEQVAQHKELLANPEQHGVNPRDLKLGLAKYIVSLFHPAQAAEAAEATFFARFRDKQLPEDMPEWPLAPHTPHLWVEVLVACGLAASKSEAKRLIEGGGVKLDGQLKVASPEETVTLEAQGSQVVQVGKRRFVKLIARS